ncbi:Hypothetical protein NTJ_01443 [Nesidiocoris tenuis]|uniref:Uncharacterized protein n=1 Tax=Nesidiocoris tenuis TaxID=355587 RepID=A0ABN7ABP0_9HEMI|nr:Hypothetical protein NTJ_01443 [Nesidiocoris tenuis]
MSTDHPTQWSDAGVGVLIPMINHIGERTADGVDRLPCHTWSVSAGARENHREREREGESLRGRTGVRVSLRP